MKGLVPKLNVHVAAGKACALCLFFWGGRYRFNAACPSCGSRERHRAYFRYYRDSEHLAKCKGRLLYIAPSQCILAPLFSTNKFGSIITSDLRPVGVTLQADLTLFPAGSGVFDRILCHHVLEHIPSDRVAIAEIYRLLAEDGVAYIAVPQNFSLKTTVEWARPNPQFSNHVRDYGLDFADRLAPFHVQQIDLSELLDEQSRDRWGLSQREILFRCTKNGEL